MNSTEFLINEKPISLQAVKDFVFKRQEYKSIGISPGTYQKIERSHHQLLGLLEKNTAIYGVTTGFGDNSHHVVDASHSEQLQENLVDYLSCATGPLVPEIATRAAFLIRLTSLTRGFSGVSKELIDRMKLYLENNWIPATPREGSLGASGDLIPLAYLAQVLQGKGELHSGNGVKETSQVLAEKKVPAYRLKAKEGLALVNGTSSMAGLSLLNLNHAHFLLETATLSTSWLCLAIQGRTDAFNTVVNEKAKMHAGQTSVAKKIRTLLASESYEKTTNVKAHQERIQDRYSLRCAPQVLGPIHDTIEQNWNWLETEINSVSDNPLIDEDGSLSMGGNFYGGYLAHGMDYLKICLANLADLLDRQLMLLMDDKTSRGLPPNLVNWKGMSEQDRYIHHGLKALHQSVSAITAEILAKATPNTIFSRSSESHNQDKVSMGMGAAVQCSEMIEQLFNVQTMVLICLCQAIDLREIKLQGNASQNFYQLIRKTVPFVKADQPLGKQIQALANQLKELSLAKGENIL
jgi:histidine ammonia-lyase